MSTERLVREALEDSVKNLSCPEPDIDQLLAAGRAMRRRRVQVVASLAAAAVLVHGPGRALVRLGRAVRAGLEPVPANPTTSVAIGASPSELQQWIDALPAGPPPATPYWHDGTLYVNGEQIPAPYAAVDIDVAGDTVLVSGYEREPRSTAPTQWMLVRGDRLEPVPVPVGPRRGVERRRPDRLLGGSPGGRTKRFVTWDTETDTVLASRTVPVTRQSCWGSTPRESPTGRPARRATRSPDGMSAPTRSTRPT